MKMLVRRKKMMQGNGLCVRALLLAGLFGVFACAQESVAPVVEEKAVEEKTSAAVWSVNPRSIRYDAASETVFVQASVEVELNGEAPREKEAFVGVTLAAEDGEEFDLAIQTIFPAQLDQTFMFSAGVEKPIQDVLIGLWDHKVQPCDSERPGCKTYGFLLDGSMASWPPTLYTDYKRQRILPSEFSFQWVGPEGSGLASQVDVGTFLKEKLGVFGSSLLIRSETGDWGFKSEEEPTSAVVLYKHPKDELLARDLAQMLGAKQSQGTVEVKAVHTLAADLMVRVPQSIQ